ncbi:DUF982 domain-containing protein [Rhizobium sp. XQZ8]|uniref:DUF982 domain-containing protein n=1 Tax=Rhizobium populisoli TaxID=2859785 RepID=UPI001CA5D4E6|nr:DUF982 domain-containing protein [Rhizobium populisoli]MBW6425104.1 DUF982 domain-containing protein [Rhizobium populisoli]
MNSVIEVAFGIAWEDPVFVRAEMFDDRAIRGPREALRYLQHDFGRQSGQAYWAAVAACNAAMRSQAHLGRSRDTFIAAYAEYRFKTDL